MPTVLLARHGETPSNREGRLMGWAPEPLSETGRAQARDLGERLADRGVDRVVASDLRRAATTADVAAAELDRDVERDERWRERDVGVLQGLRAEDAFGDNPHLDVFEAGEAAVDRAPEGGESLADLRERVLEGWRAVRERPGTTLVVTHGGPVTFLLGSLRGLSAAEALETYEVENCAVAELEVEDGETRIVAEP